MIDMHNKLTPCTDARFPMVEIFRKGDLADFSLGIVKSGLSGAVIRSVKGAFPNAGFHKRLVQLATRRLFTHPLSPAPMMKW